MKEPTHFQLQPWFGFAFDTFGNYQFILTAMLVFPALAFIAAIISPPLVKSTTE